MALGDREVLQAYRWIDGAFKRFQQSSRPAVHCLPVYRSPGCARGMTKKDVLGNRQLVEEHGLLMDSGYACVDRGLRAGKGCQPAVDEDLAFVGAIDAGQDLDE